ncbi:uncharacterized protein LOC126803351 [Argentina anserina]|uniref:uncharacterized protein LOC126803351 n=1 Tax=Argentina anserina TaxID=57926 RepID=UPI0021762BFA|nr:uncharacterized protein LOC126803351 [Potentilla anserina]
MIDKGWVKLTRTSVDYKAGLQEFLLHSVSVVADSFGRIKCPCKKCRNGQVRLPPEVVRDHLIVHGMFPPYEDGLWVDHGEDLPNPNFQENIEVEVDDDLPMDTDMMDLLADAFRGDNATFEQHNVEEGEPANVRSEDQEQFLKSFKDAETSLYPGSKMSKLEFLIRFFQVKCLSRMTDKALTLMLKLFKSVLPDGNTLPSTFYLAKKSITDLSLTYQKIDACPNDCMLYWKNKAHLHKCDECGVSRYKDAVVEEGEQQKKVSAKVLRYFPLTPRLQRLYMSRHTSENMVWHGTKKPNDDCMRHPADSPAWKEVDKLYPSFASDFRNVRLGLASDGFNPFGHLSTSHSTWPVVLTVYNLPPWLCMKKPYIILSLLIPGPKAPGMDIDVYLAPLIDELKTLWDVGVPTFDMFTKQTFTMRAVLLWTINDFPAYAYLSGWSTSGKKACPFCNHDHSSCRLKYGQKQCYMGHRRFLSSHHRFRKESRQFNGKEEHRPAPKPLSGRQCLLQLSKLKFKYGKWSSKSGPRRKKSDPKLKKGPWKKHSIFYDLPYWADLLIRHILDVMHIEKNFLEILLGTLLGIDGKNKDTLKARADLEWLKIKPNLHPVRKGTKTYLPPASFTLTKAEKILICQVLASFRPSDSYSSNIANCIKVNEAKLTGLKSHDCHIIMQQLLPIAIRKVLPVQICKVLLERIFPPAFFVIMIHLPIHLAYEASIAGPVFYRWMYPIERYLGTLKGYVRNRSQPEGSIAEGYIVDECLSYCSMYLDDMETHHNRSGRNADGEAREFPTGYSIFLNAGRSVQGKGKDVHLNYDEWDRLRRHVLSNCPEVQPFREEHRANGRANKGRRTLWQADKDSNASFPQAFKDHVCSMQASGVQGDIHPDLLALAKDPSQWCKTYTKYVVNGYRFRINRVDRKKSTQNSGVFVNANVNSYTSVHDRNPRDGLQDYYGKLVNVIELQYDDGRKIVLFDCDWVQSGGNSAGLKTDQYGFTLVNFNKLLPPGDTLILASQAEQVIYVQDPIDKEWQVAIKTKPRDLLDLVEVAHTDPCHPQDLDDPLLDGIEVEMRADIPGVTMNQELPPVVAYVPELESSDTSSEGEA